MTYEKFLQNLNARGMFRIRPDLRRVRKVLDVLGNPQDRIPAIHIAGTNGKGSVAAALETVLRTSGYRTGLYTSPHLIDLRERIQIAGAPFIEGFVEAADHVFKAEKRIRSPLTYFELLTAIAFQAFYVKDVEIAVVECGLGGLWDATNVLKRPLLSMITSIGLDHTEWLGNTEVQIAAQKAGIIKRKGHVISGVRGAARSVIWRSAREKQAALEQIDMNFEACPLTVSWQTGKQTLRFLYKGESPQIIPFGLLGDYQADNAALVMAAIRQLKQKGWRISDADRDRGLKHVNWPGRLQVIRPPLSAPLLLDGAHNASAMQRLLDSIPSSPFRNVPKTFIFSAYKDKDFKSMASMITRVAAEVCLCPLPSPRGAALQDLRSAFSKLRGPLRICKSISDALTNAMRDTPREGVVIVAGSLALIGSVLSVIPTRARDDKMKTHV